MNFDYIYLSELLAVYSIFRVDKNKVGEKQKIVCCQGKN